MCICIDENAVVAPVPQILPKIFIQISPQNPRIPFVKV